MMKKPADVVAAEAMARLLGEAISGIAQGLDQCPRLAIPDCNRPPPVSRLAKARLFRENACNANQCHNIGPSISLWDRPGGSPSRCHSGLSHRLVDALRNPARVNARFGEQYAYR